ncbi:RNA polymerase sigma factor [Streptomyces sp. SAS_276]
MSLRRNPWLSPSKRRYTCGTCGSEGAGQTLAAADQEILALHVWEGLTAKEAARVLGCTRASCSMRLTRAKRRLAGQLGQAAATESSALSLSTR